LKEVGLLDSTLTVPEQRTAARRAVHIHVNAGIIVKGSENVICSGMPKLFKGAATGVGAAAAGKGKAEASCAEDSVGLGVRVGRGGLIWFVLLSPDFWEVELMWM
jgi:hypothetical protein